MRAKKQTQFVLYFPWCLCPHLSHSSKGYGGISKSYTECPKIYRKSVLHLLKYRFVVYFSRRSTYLRKILGHSVVEDFLCQTFRRGKASCLVIIHNSIHVEYQKWTLKFYSMIEQKKSPLNSGQQKHTLKNYSVTFSKEPFWYVQNITILLRSEHNHSGTFRT